MVIEIDTQTASKRLEVQGKTARTASQIWAAELGKFDEESCNPNYLSWRSG